MRRTAYRQFRHTITQYNHVPLIRISNATFYRQNPKESHSSPPAVAQHEHDSNEAVPLDQNPPLFPNLNFTLQSQGNPNEHWSVISPSSGARTTFLHILRGQNLCFPPIARSYPYLASHSDPRLRYPGHAIQYVGFDAERDDKLSGGGMRGAYLSARYEARREETDFSLMDYLLGNTELNADQTLVQHPEEALLKQVMTDLKLESLGQYPVSNLSNGQTRRARIAKALLSKPELLLLDGPFMGLDPPTRQLISKLLFELAEARAPRILLSLKPDEDIPSWITHIALIDGNYTVDSQGPKEEVFEDFKHREAEFKTSWRPKRLGSVTPDALAFIDLSRHLKQHTRYAGSGHTRDQASYYGLANRLARTSETVKNKKDEAEDTAADKSDDTQSKFMPSSVSRDGFGPVHTQHSPIGDDIVSMDGVVVRYGSGDAVRTVLGGWSEQQPSGETRDGLHWTVRRGERWGVFGANGSGKTTLLSLITSDHPQTYSLPIKLFGCSRLPSDGKPGLSIFDLQARIGHSSPEVHAFFPKSLSVRRVIESAWADTPLTKPRLTYEVDEKVSACLRWFQGEIHPSLGPRAWMAREMTRDLEIDRHWAKTSSDPSRKKHTNFLTHVAEELDSESVDPHDLEWADTLTFREVSFSAQRVLLFLRAVVKNPDLVILDEAFSGMDDEARDRCLLFLSRGQSMMFRYVGYNQSNRAKGFRSEAPRPTRSDIDRLGRVVVGGLTQNQALVVVSHKKEEVPGCVREWITLPEPGTGPPRSGRLGGPLELYWPGWREIWGVPIRPGRHNWKD